MLTRVVLPVIVTTVVAVGTVQMWRALQGYEHEQVERIVTLESWSTRSHLARTTEAMLDALRNNLAFWDAVSNMPRDQWPSGEHLESANYRGIDLILYEAPAKGVRVLHSEQHPGYAYQPTDAEWARYAALAKRLREQDTSTMMGPYAYADGDLYLEVYLVDGQGDDRHGIAAVVDADVAIGHILLDEAPSYAVDVYWGNRALIQGEGAAREIPPGWQQEGQIRNSLGAVWRVVHRPTTETVQAMASTATDAVLLLGLIIAVLMGFLTYESARARRRASKAEAAERQLAALNRDLEAIIARRTRSLEDRTADLQTITDSVAHDLRNPLNAISMSAQLLESRLDREDDEQSLRVVRRIHPCVSQMATIVDRLSGLSVLAHETFERETLDMRDLFEDVFEPLLATDTYGPVAFSIVDDLPDAHADELLVRMLVTNLLSNALKYTRDTENRRIDVLYEEIDGVTVYKVGDNGIGFDNDTADELFAAFQRGSGSEQFDGTGLGLTIVARVVERHGGRVWAEGEPGNGACFQFTLEPGKGPEEPCD